jgi:succinate dehydrogenase / fumarate reductase cytochrome b subunit
MSNPSSHNFLRWFDARGRQAGSWAFILNRLTALALTFYLGLHLVVLNKLTQGAQAYDDFVAFAQTPLLKAGEVILIAAVVLHGLNGLRLTLLAFGIGLHRQRFLFVMVAIATILASAAFAIRLFVE